LNRRALVMAVVVLLHGLLLAAAWFARVELPHHEDEALLVALLRDPAPVRDEKLPAPPPVQITVPMPAVIVDNAPAIEIPVIEAAPAPTPAVHVASAAPAPAAPESLETELAVQCPERTAPRYPALAKRQREQGEVRLRVELDESGRIDRVTIVSSSGSPRLDDAARAAIESWRCRPAQHDGQPVRAVALQSLAFVLERH
jgi:periplasmic protein TonB